MPSEYELLMEQKEAIIFEDEDLVVAVKDKVFTPGQITVFPKKKVTILEQVPDDILEKCSVLVNKASIAAFEGLGAQGTNVIIQNGLAAGQKVSHFGIEIVPRQQDDPLNFMWEGKPEQEDELDRVAEKIKEALTAKPVVKEPAPEEKAEKKKGKNYLLKSLRKIP